jgi:hypothetical protein
LLEPLLPLPFEVGLVGAHEPIPEDEEGAEVGFVVGVVVVVSVGAVGGQPTREGTPGEVVSGVGIDGLEDADREPDPEGHDVSAQEKWTQDGRDGVGQHRLDGMSELGGDADGGLEAVVLGMDVLVEPGEMEESMGPVEEGVVDDDGDREGGEELSDSWQRVVEPHAEMLEDREEEIEREGLRHQVTHGQVDEAALQQPRWWETTLLYLVFLEFRKRPQRQPQLRESIESERTSRETFYITSKRLK